MNALVLPGLALAMLVYLVVAGRAIFRQVRRADEQAMKPSPARKTKPAAKASPGRSGPPSRH